MIQKEYPSEICSYCVCTDYGWYPVNTNQYNICEGQGCEEAYRDWKEENPDDDRTLEEMF